MTYREQFASGEMAAAYDDEQYGARSYSSVLWTIEQEQLTAVLTELRQEHPEIDYLDFATGTGRVLHFLADHVDTATGIEVSPAMAERARSHGTANVLCRDITRRTDREGVYDLITAFRFILNAEPALRSAALTALRVRLRDQTSRLIINNHGNVFSHKALSAPLHSRGRARRGHVTEGNLLTHRQMVRLLRAAGLQVVERRGCGILPARLHERFPSARLERAEALASRTWLGRLGVNQMYVVRVATAEAAA